MKRREFIALTGGVVAGWPGRTHAQPAQADDVDSLRQGLRDLGYIEEKT
jgi:hypothetical protein